MLEPLQPALDPEQLLDLAARSGAERAEVYATASHSEPVFFEANRLKQLESVQAEGVSLRVWCHGRPGTAVAYGPVDPQALVDRAIAVSALHPPEEFLGGEVRRQVLPSSGDRVPVADLIASGRAAIAQLREAHPELICNGEWSCEQETVRLLDSRGLDLTQTDATVSAYLEAQWIRGDDFLAVGEDGIGRQLFDPETLTWEILRRLDWARRSASVPRSAVPVLLAAKATDLVWGTVQAALNGRQVLDGASPWGDRLGQMVLNPALTLRQDPSMAPYDCPFDDEGTVTQALTLVEDGQLRAFYSDRRCGRRLGTGSTGNGFRPDLGSAAQPALANLVVEPGTESLEDLIRGIEDGILVDQLLGGGADISGDFSVNLDLAYRIRKGEIVGRLKDTMISGNVYRVLAAPLALGSDSRWTGSSWTPSLRLQDISLTGRD